ncbi:hypothetical protein PRECH8_15990 [Insulibacter thermoxylanivorax]|uniref:DUF309 domain-containing protein n=1 Tax=Insulibacter thermoxylanivorax TaxID=2749268 RepID=A0A916VFV8_9BACL|nr:DUF309 domain-containing protein [Insulibacter thermoxylanivorax]GFR38303.1 hypothetical protein PRECH8_15990 [Insulibacter thermoxylanivorax]
MEQLHQKDYGRYPDAYIDYLVQFQAVRDYFECHEILEEYWKEHPDSPYRETWVMLIQLAVSIYHHRRGNLRGAVKLMKGALRRYEAEHMAQLGVDGARLREMMEKRLAEYIGQPELPFIDLNIPIADEALRVCCVRRAEMLGYAWERASDLTDRALLDRHLLRDRSAVSEEREAALQKKRDSRS